MKVNWQTRTALITERYVVFRRVARRKLGITSFHIVLGKKTNKKETKKIIIIKSTRARRRKEGVMVHYLSTGKGNISFMYCYPHMSYYVKVSYLITL